MATPPKPPIGASRNALEAWLAHAADQDSGLRNNVLRNTHATLQQLVGRPVPGDIKVVAMEEAATDLYVVRRFEGATEPVEADSTDAQVLRSAIHAIAVDEEGFWDKLTGNPKAVLAERLALNLPPQVQMHVLNEDPHTAYLVLHHAEHLKAWTLPAPLRQRIGLRK
jgi:hypothetical protein